MSFTYQTINYHGKNLKILIIGCVFCKTFIGSKFMLSDFISEFAGFSNYLIQRNHKNSKNSKNGYYFDSSISHINKDTCKDVITV